MHPTARLKQQHECQRRFSDFEYISGVNYCDPVYDPPLCWGPTPAGQTSFQRCPPERLSHEIQFAQRSCGSDGVWLSGYPNDTACAPYDIKALLEKASQNDYAQFMFQIARNTRKMDIVELSISFITLILALYIFHRFRSLRNNRTRIHQNLFSAMLLHKFVRLVVCIHNEFVQSEQGDHSASVNATIHGIDNLPPYTCEIAKILAEYGISVVFMWMLIEALYFKSLVSGNALRDPFSHMVYFMIGWGVPLINILMWAAVTYLHYETEKVKQCWHGYNLLKTYWIVQGFRLAIIIYNIFIYMNVLRVLVGKMIIMEHPDITRTMKASRTALCLQPLLGLINALNMLEPSVGRPMWLFATWSYSTHIIVSFQGLFISLTYCFLNYEVRAVLGKYYRHRRAIQETRRRQQSLFRGDGRRRPTNEGRASTSTARSEGTQVNMPIPIRTQRWARGQQYRQSEIGVSMPNIRLNRRSTGTDTSSPVSCRRYSDESGNVVVQHIVTIEPRRLQNKADRHSDSRIHCIHHPETRL